MLALTASVTPRARPSTIALWRPSRRTCVSKAPKPRSPMFRLRLVDEGRVLKPKKEPAKPIEVSKARPKDMAPPELEPVARQKKQGFFRTTGPDTPSTFDYGTSEMEAYSLKDALKKIQVHAQHKRLEQACQVYQDYSNSGGERDYMLDSLYLKCLGNLKQADQAEAFFKGMEASYGANNLNSTCYAVFLQLYGIGELKNLKKYKEWHARYETVTPNFRTYSIELQACIELKQNHEINGLLEKIQSSGGLKDKVVLSQFVTMLMKSHMHEQAHAILLGAVNNTTFDSHLWVAFFKVLVKLNKKEELEKFAHHYISSYAIRQEPMSVLVSGFSYFGVARLVDKFFDLSVRKIKGNKILIYTSMLTHYNRTSNIHAFLELVIQCLESDEPVDQYFSQRIDDFCKQLDYPVELDGDLFDIPRNFSSKQALMTEEQRNYTLERMHRILRYYTQLHNSKKQDVLASIENDLK